MSVRRLVRIPEACNRLAVGKTKLREDFINSGRLHLVYLGPKTARIDEAELNALIDAMIANPIAQAADTAAATAEHMRRAAEKHRRRACSTDKI